MRVVGVSDGAIALAAECLTLGQVVAFPTETVYGLGADATNQQAIERLYAVKLRSPANPLIIHLAGPEQLSQLAVVTPQALSLAGVWWPGPLTVVLKHRCSSPVVDTARAGLDTVALRVPSHPVALRLLKAVGRPIAAASANLSGTISATNPGHIIDSFAPGRASNRPCAAEQSGDYTRSGDRDGDRIPSVAMVLAGGRSDIGLESTVVDLSDTPAKILRPGSIGLEELERCIHPVVEHNSKASSQPRAPGQLGRHYAPLRPLRLAVRWAHADEGLLTFGPDTFIRGGGQRLNLSPSSSLYEAATNLYDMMRTLDRPPHTALAVVEIPSCGIGVAINDRLRRAASGAHSAR